MAQRRRPQSRWHQLAPRLGLPPDDPQQRWCWLLLRQLSLKSENVVGTDIRVGAVAQALPTQALRYLVMFGELAGLAVRAGGWDLPPPGRRPASSECETGALRGARVL